MAKFAFMHREDQETIMGSEQYLPLDGRLNIGNLIRVAKEQAIRLKGLHSDIYSVRIYTGTVGHPIAISGYHVVNFNN